MDLRYTLDLLKELTRKEVKVRYKNSYLGYLWSIGNPLALAVVFYFVFVVVAGARFGQKDYMALLICGLFPWQWFQNSVSGASLTFVGNSSLIKKVFFPRELLVYAMVMSDLIHFLVSIPIIFAAVLIVGLPPSFMWLAFPLVILPQLLLVSGVALFVSTINLFFRDLERLVVVMLTLAFYCTPVIYPESEVPAQFAPYMKLNPMAPLIACYRDVFMNNSFDFQNWILAMGYGIVAFLVGYLVYSRLKWRFAELV